MADMKFITTSSEKLSDISVQKGQLIFVKDTRAIYLDTDTRTSFAQIITLDNEEQRQALAYPLVGFYFIKSTKSLWEYDSYGWIQVSTSSGGGGSEPGVQQIVFGDSLDDFPLVGQADLLYVTSNNTYRWFNNKYTQVTGDNSSKWITI